MPNTARSSLRYALTGATALLASSMATGVYAQAVQSPPAAAPQAATGGPAKVEEIIVTSQRRAVSIQEVPVSVTAFSGQKLAERQIRTISDIATITPNVTLASTYAEAHVQIRGAGENLTDLGADPAVAIHLDDVYIARPEFGFSDLLDVQRVEILRGPQGTLFGHNATGGIVNIIPNTPSANFDAGVSATLGVDPTVAGVQGFVSGKLNADDTLEGRIAVQENYNEGYFKNLDPAGPGHLNGQNEQSIRAQLQWKPNEAFKSRLSVDVVHDSDGGPYIAIAGLPVGNPNGTVNPAESLGGVQTNPHKWEANVNEGVSKRWFTDVALHSELKLGSGTLQLIDSYTQTRSYFDVDQDATNLNFADLAFADHAAQVFNELLYQSPQKGRLRYQIGAVQFYEDATEDVNAHSGFLAPPFTPADFNPIHLGGRVETQSYAGFGHAEFDVTTAFHLFGGYRFTYDYKSDNEFNSFIGALKQHDSWTNSTYQVGGRYDVSKDINVYASYSTGYKGGGFNTGSLTPAFNPETDGTVEVGLKAALFERRMTIDLSAFTNDYSNLQVNRVSTFSSEVANAAAATINGVELEMAGRPTDHLRLELTASYLDAKFNTYSTQDASRPLLGTLNLKGNYLPSAPPYEFSAGGYYTFDLPSSQSIEVGGRAYGQGQTYFTPFNVKAVGQAPVVRADLTALYRIDDHWTVQFFAKNVGNMLVKNYGQGLANIIGGGYEVNYDAGRTVGVTAAWRY